MITTGSKFFYGLAGVGLLAAVVYGIITNGLEAGGVVSVLTGDGAVDALLGPVTAGYKGGVGDHLGYTILLGFAATCFGLGLATSFFRDADPDALAQLDGRDDAPAVVASKELTYWPLIMAFAATLAMLGLATSPTLFVIGCVIATVAGAEWAVAAWADTATGDPVVNRIVRNRFMHPIEIPIGGFIGAAVVVFCFSRIFLATAGVGAMIVATGLAAVVFIAALIMNAQPQMKRVTAVWSGILFGIAVLVVGIVGAVVGVAEHEGHGPGPASQQIETGTPSGPGAVVSSGESL